MFCRIPLPLVSLGASCVLMLVLFPTAGGAQDEGLGLDSIRRATPSGQYIDPASFFRFHGYVNLGFSEVGEELNNGTNTPHILVSGMSPRSGVNESGFHNDVALFLGGEPLDGVATVVELHFVGDGFDPVLTEAKLELNLAEGSDRDALRLGFGRFWWPFGGHNAEWFSAVNPLTLVSPAAAEVVPAHYNEVGAYLEGEHLISPSAGLNYIVSVGNGTPSMELSDVVRNTGFDHNANRAITGRLGLSVGSRGQFKVAISGTHGRFREGLDTSFDAQDARRYGATFSAGGPDLSFVHGPFRVHGYYYFSQEGLEGAPVDELSRSGFTVEPSWTFSIGTSQKSLSLHFRASSADEELLGGGEQRLGQFGGGIVLGFKRGLKLRASYLALTEGLQAPSASNDFFSLGITAEF